MEYENLVCLLKLRGKYVLILFSCTLCHGCGLGLLMNISAPFGT